MAANGAFLMRLLRLIWRILVGVKDALVLLFMLLFFGALYAALAGRAATVVPSEAALTLDLDGVIVDQPAEQPPLALLSGGSTLVREIRVRDVVHRSEARCGGKVSGSMCRSRVATEYYKKKRK